MSSYVAAAIEDGVGIVALTNADTKADAIQMIVDIVAEKVLLGSRNPSSPSSSTPATTAARRSNLLPPRPHAGVTRRNNDVDLTGTYCNAGYGTGVLCSVRSTSPSCKCVLEAFRSIDPSLSPKSTSNDLFAPWVTLFSTHIRFTYNTTDNDGHRYYLISAGSIYPQGYGKNTTAFSTLVPIAKAEFVVEQNGKSVVGFGWNNLVDAAAGVQQRSGSVEETSEVWFVKQA